MPENAAPAPDRTPAGDVEPLHISFHGRVLEHLGIQMYQSPVNALAEFVANAWDAEARTVNIYLPATLAPGAAIVIADDGLGMARQECQNRFLCVGYNRRKDNPDERSPNLGRPILGRKGIGKFAGFGIAEVIRIDTTSAETGERTVFELDLRDLLGEEYIGTEDKPVREMSAPPAEAKRIGNRGTVITLSRLKLRQRVRSDFPKSMARRFLVLERQADFKVKVDGQELPKSLSLEDVQYCFPRDYVTAEKPDTMVSVDAATGSGRERLPNGREIQWRIVFHTKPVEEEELRGVTVYAKGKLVQAPFLFQVTGGLGGQHGVEYLTGQVEADYLDMLPEDITATERQRINWENDEAAVLLAWGKERTKQLLRIWRDRRGEARRTQIEEKVAGFSRRLEKLEVHERRTIKGALTKIGGISTLSDEQFQELGDAVLQAWEQGRLHELIDRMSSTEDMDEQELLKILMEAQALTALNAAEAVKTKLLTVGGLKLRIQRKDLENAVRDYIAANPWLISPEWETFRTELSVYKLAQEAAREADLDEENWGGRVDLALSSGHHLLILEFMRPGLRINWNHVDRFDRYIRIIRTRVAANTGGPFRYVTGYVIADDLTDDAALLDRIREMRDNGMHALDWDTLFEQALAKWREFLNILASRSPHDERLSVLLDRPKVGGAP